MVATCGEPRATDEVFGVEDGPGLGILFHGRKVKGERLKVNGERLTD